MYTGNDIAINANRIMEQILTWAASPPELTEIRDAPKSQAYNIALYTESESISYKGSSGISASLYSAGAVRNRLLCWDERTEDHCSLHWRSIDTKIWLRISILDNIWKEAAVLLYLRDRGNIHFYRKGVYCKIAVKSHYIIFPIYTHVDRFFTKENDWHTTRVFW